MLNKLTGIFVNKRRWMALIRDKDNMIYIFSLIVLFLIYFRLLELINDFVIFAVFLCNKAEVYFEKPFFAFSWCNSSTHILHLSTLGQLQEGEIR